MHLLESFISNIFICLFRKSTGSHYSPTLSPLSRLAPLPLAVNCCREGSKGDDVSNKNGQLTMLTLARSQGVTVIYFAAVFAVSVAARAPALVVEVMPSPQYCLLRKRMASAIMDKRHLLFFPLRRLQKSGGGFSFPFMLLCMDKSSWNSTGFV